MDWFIQEGAIQKKDNIYIAERAFLANTFINWIRREAKRRRLKSSDIEKSMHILKLFLRKEIDLEWKDGAIIIVEKSFFKKKESIEKYREATNIE